MTNKSFTRLLIALFFIAIIAACIMTIYDNRKIEKVQQMTETTKASPHLKR